MTIVAVELSAELYERLHIEAERQGKAPEDVAEAWLTERLANGPDRPSEAVSDSREQVRAALRAKGLLVEPTPEELAWAETVDVTIEEVSAALDRAGGRPLSEIIIEQRGPKG